MDEEYFVLGRLMEIPATSCTSFIFGDTRLREGRVSSKGDISQRVARLDVDVSKAAKATIDIVKTIGSWSAGRSPPPFTPTPRT
eukprot:scaffold53588_cov30-Tisochrysis_lutea.AAC.2